METDLQVLSNRIARLESLLGPPPPTQSPCIHERAKKAQQNLRTHVPDEMAAAHRAVTMLSHSTPSLRGLQYARQTKAARAEYAVNRVAAALQDMEAVQDGLQMDADTLCVDSELQDALCNVQTRLADVEAPAMEVEEQNLDRLLMEFSDATARLNTRIVDLARTIRGPDNGDEK